MLLVDRRASSMSDLDQVKVILRTEGTTHFSHSDLWNIFPLLMQIHNLDKWTSLQDELTVGIRGDLQTLSSTVKQGRG